MKTVVDLPRPPISHQVRPARRPSTIRLGLIVSVVAAFAAVLVESLTRIPSVLIVVAVVVVGFSLSWHASGRARAQDHDLP